jgi:AcrR family transcriptional regulator
MVVMSDVTTKDRITAAATYLLTEHGAAGVSMRKVAAAVGITPMAIYQYFPDRETLLNAIADAAFVELVRRWESAERPSQADFRARKSPTLNLVADAITAGVDQELFRADTDIWETSLMFAALLHGLIQLHHGDRIGMPEQAFRALCLRLGERMINELRT